MSIQNLLATLVKFTAYSMPVSAQRLLSGSFIPVFMLHRMECPELGLSGQKPEHLSETLELLRRHKFNFISLEDVFTHLSNHSHPPPRSVAFTMDDGFFDHYSIAAPIFDNFDCPATFFLITDFINQQLWPWDDQVAYIIEHCDKDNIQLPDPDSTRHPLNTTKNKQAALHAIIETLKTQSNTHLYEKLEQLYISAGITAPGKIPEKYQPMSWENARTLNKKGHTVAAHTKTHRILSQLNEDESREEIIGSIDEVRRHTGMENFFAYPTGRSQDFGEREIDILQETSIKAAVSTVHHSATPFQGKQQNYQIPRFALPDNQLDLAQYASWMEVFKNRIRPR